VRKIPVLLCYGFCLKFFYFSIFIYIDIQKLNIYTFIIIYYNQTYKSNEQPNLQEQRTSRMSTAADTSVPPEFDYLEFICAVNAELASKGADSGVAATYTTVYTAVVAYNEAASRALTTNQAADTARERARAFGKVDNNSTDYKDAFEVGCIAALVADAATASKLNAKAVLDTSFAAYMEASAAAKKKASTA
jgi:hypothetical protein